MLKGHIYSNVLLTLILSLHLYVKGVAAPGVVTCRESVNSGLDYWNGLLDWTTRPTFDLRFSIDYYWIFYSVCKEK